MLGELPTNLRQDYWRYTPSGANQLAVSAGLEAPAGGFGIHGEKPMEKPVENMEKPWKIYGKSGKPMENL